MSKVIGIGFVGAGGNTKLRHLPGLAAIKDVRLVSVANRSEESSCRVAREFGVEKSAPDWRAVVDDPEVDAVCIGTWPYMHAEVTVAALAAGKHVLTEARMAADLEGARRMLAAAEQHPGLVAQIVPSPFTLDLDSTVLGLVESGRLGAIREIHIDHSHAALLDPEAPLTWRQDPAASGINMLTMGIYHEITGRWFPDAATVDQVTAGIAVPQRRHWETGERVPVRLPDYLHIFGRLERGTLLHYHFSGIEPGPGRNEIKLIGSLATLRVDVAGGRLFLSKPGGSEAMVDISSESRRGWRVEEDFLDSIRRGFPVRLTSFSDGLRYMQFTDAVHRKLDI